MLRRTDSQDEMIHFQSGRFVQQNSEWFYMTREGSQMGPFKRKEDADVDLAAFMIYLQKLETDS